MNTVTVNDAVEILLVEDNPGDVRLTKETLKESTFATNLHVVEDGVEALAFLRQEDDYTEAPTPDIILLDLNLPRKNGREVLGEIKKDETLRRIPVVVLTTSDDKRDILASYNRYANCYITKPINIDRFIDIVKSIGDFWLSVVKLPPE